MRYLGVLFLLFSTSVWSQTHIPEILAHFRLNETTNPEVKPGEVVNVDIWFSNSETGKNFTDFVETDGKYMHMLLIKDDLSTIVNVYPSYDPQTGMFKIALNAPNEDPANFQTDDALLTPGIYQIVTDVESKSVGLRTANITISVVGEYNPTTLVLDPVDADFSITKYFSQFNNDYKATISHSIIVGCFGFIVDFNFDIKIKQTSSDYMPLKDITPMFGVGGHAFWGSEVLTQGGLVNFLRIAAPVPLEDGKLVFRFNDRNILKQGVQKIWFKLKHGENFLSFPFVFEYYPPLDDINYDCTHKQSMRVDSLHY